jgi:hypothetical protein
MGAASGGVYPPMAGLTFGFVYGFDFYACCILNSIFFSLYSVFSFSPPSADMEIFCPERKNQSK